MMTGFDREIREKITADSPELPQKVRERIDETLASLPEKGTNKMLGFRRVLAAAACAAAVALFVMPNISMTYANAAEKIPVIGGIIRVCTVRNYIYSDAENELMVEVPEVEGAQEINLETAELTDRIVADFYTSLGEGHRGVYADYEVVMENDDWFTLKISVEETEASGYNYRRYYHIHKATGEYVRFSDLFEDSAPITEELVRKMQEEMLEDPNVQYSIGQDGFSGLAEDQSFYFDENGDLVIVFDEYSIAPGAQGSPEFTLPHEMFMPLINEKYADAFAK